MARSWKMLLVDDDPLIAQAFELILPENWSMTVVQEVDNLDVSCFHAAFVDMHLKGNLQTIEGVGIIQTISKKSPLLEIIAISGDLNQQIMEDCLKAGATRFLAKPFRAEEVQSILEKIEALYLLHAASTRGGTFKKYYIGNGEFSKDLKKQISQMRGEAGPILIEGESGTGKEVTVQMLQEQESDRPFVAVNIAAIPENLFESELFGHVKGAFTGADQNKMGLAEAAHGGDLFLDEIEALSLTSQVKLLRFLETSEVRKVGAKQSTNISVRVIAATNQNLETLVSEGKFREDLLWRLNGKKITLAPLRQRKDEIQDIAVFFLKQQLPKYNKTFSPEALEVIKQHPWPGNIRELKRVIEQVCLTAPLPFIRAEDIESLLKTRGSNKADHEELDFTKSLDEIMGLYERSVIERFLNKYNDIDKCAAALKISRSGLYKKMKDYNLELKN